MFKADIHKVISFLIKGRKRQPPASSDREEIKKIEEASRIVGERFGRALERLAER